MNRFALLASIVLCLTVVPSSLAQGLVPDPTETARPVVMYRYVEPGQEAIWVNVWGDVQAPGRYEVRKDISMMELLFLAGGPGEKVQSSGQKRRTTVRLSRQLGDGQWSVVYETPLEEAMLSPFPSGLQDEDVLKVETFVKDRFIWTDAVSLITAAAAVSLAVDRIFF